MIKSFMKGLSRFLLSVCIWIIVYGIASVLGTLIPTTKMKKEPIGKASQVTVYLISNGFHTEWLFPIRYQSINWLREFGSEFTSYYQPYNYLAIGWGDRDFYMNSKTLPSLYTTSKALLWPSESVLQVVFYKNLPRGVDVVQLHISTEQYQSLYSFVQSQFKKKKSNDYILLSHKLGSRQLFFGSWGFYHCLNTCNNWTNRGINILGNKTGLWTPLAWGVLYHQREAE